MGSENILIWNVRGLNARSHQDVVCELVGAKRPSIVCFQETKLSLILDYDLAQIVGVGFDYCYLPAMGMRGGILVAWRSAVWSVSMSSRHMFSDSVSIKHSSQDQPWWLTCVYGPSVEGHKDDFLTELNMLTIRAGPWLLCSDFNWIFRAQDKNNDRLDSR
jgi:exonuclease III